MSQSAPIPVRYKCWPSYAACQPYLRIAEHAVRVLIEQARRGVPAEKFGDSVPDASALFLVGKMQRVIIKGVGTLTFQPRLLPDAAGRRIIIASVVLERLDVLPEEGDCVCCTGCVAVGVIGGYKYFDEDKSASILRYGVSVCIKGGAFYVKNALAVDSNFFHKKGDRVIVYSTPFLLSRGNMPVQSNHIFVRYDGTDDNPSPVTQSKWSILNCGEWNIETDDVSFDENGIFTEYIDNRDSCETKKGKVADIETLDIIEVELYHYITSIKAGLCYA